MSQRQVDEAIERGRIPEPPSTWYPLDSILNLPSQGDSRPLSEGSSLEAGRSSTRRRGRGPSLKHESWSKDGGKIIIEKNDRGQPIMDETSSLASNMGALARDGSLLPLHYVDWRCVPSHYKKRVWDGIKAHTDADDSMEKWFMQSLSKKWAGWKFEAKKQGYRPYDNDADRLANRPDRVTKQQWRCLVYYWGDQEVQAKSQRNKTFRSSQTLLHTTGRTPHYLVEQKEKKLKKKPTRIDMFIKTHTKKNGVAVNEATGAILKKLKELRPSQDGSNSPSITEGEIFTEALGPERHGRVRGYGLGVTPSQLFAVSKHNQYEQEIMKLKTKMKKMERAFRAMGYTLEDTDDDLDESRPNDNPLDASSANRHSHRDSQPEIDPPPPLPKCPTPLSQLIQRSDLHFKPPDASNAYRQVTPNCRRDSQTEIDLRLLSSIQPTPLSQLRPNSQWIRKGKRKRLQRNMD